MGDHGGGYVHYQHFGVRGDSCSLKGRRCEDDFIESNTHFEDARTVLSDEKEIFDSSSSRRVRFPCKTKKIAKLASLKQN